MMLKISHHLAHKQKFPSPWLLYSSYRWCTYSDSLHCVSLTDSEHFFSDSAGDKLLPRNKCNAFLHSVKWSGVISRNWILRSNGTTQHISFVTHVQTICIWCKLRSGFLMSKRTESCKQARAFTHAQFRTCACSRGSWLSVAWHQRYSPELMEISVESLCNVFFSFLSLETYYFSHPMVKWIHMSHELAAAELFGCVSNTNTDSSLCVKISDMREICQRKYCVNMLLCYGFANS